MQHAEAEPNVFSYSAAISSCEKCGQWPQALHLLAEMQEDEVEPNVYSFSAAISACAVDGQWQNAFLVFWKMVSAGVTPNLITLNAALTSCEKGAEWQLAVSLLSRMLGFGLTPDVISFSAAMSACAKCGEWQATFSLLSDSGAAQLMPDTIMNNAAAGLSQLAKKLDIGNSLSISSPPCHCPAALAILFQMFTALSPNQISFNASISACEKGGHVEDAPNEMRSFRVEAGSTSFNAAISACEKRLAWQQAVQLLSDLLLTGIEANVISYNAAISACEKALQWKIGLELLSAMMVCDAKEWQAALALLLSIAVLEVAPSVISVNAAITACVQALQWQIALHLFAGIVEVPPRTDACAAGVGTPKLYSAPKDMAVGAGTTEQRPTPVSFFEQLDQFVASGGNAVTFAVAVTLAEGAGMTELLCRKGEAAAAQIREEAR
ncbi:Pentatricopeptide repeat-containing protein, chloroplastic [Symbiodinium microadriaticum]|uniref:Pentatricopeptide repeat-containing protein, chloroplastic n=1 Tax=Symbiodinium microadriaticum TaxID=2951 RepID=A0A1Q9EH61_SYMMI|nr:Pentatricopeptide repeat-containing protein, chloroplastic [Symbiodinium microadriaticum]